MIRNWILLTVILNACSCSLYSKDTQELIISLPTRHDLKTVHLSLHCPKPSVFVPNYLDQLLDILSVDLSNNGSVCIQDTPTHNDFVIQLTIIDRQVIAEITSNTIGITHTLPPYSLQGSLASDRRIMHRINDDLTQRITGVSGIASLRILYAVQQLEETTDNVRWKSEIWEADYDGENAHPVTQENDYCITPIYLPATQSGKKILYVNYRQGPSKIYLTSVGTPQGTPIVPVRGNQLLPAISRQGDKLAFICDASGRADLFIQAFNSETGVQGKPLQLFSYPRSVQASPTFRPDGKKIAFVSDKEGTPRIFLIDVPDGHRAKNCRPICLTKKYRHNTCPSWSPDGMKLAYSAMIDGIRQIMVYDFVSREEIQLTTGKMHKENPNWAPNSLHITYNTVGNSSELFLINLKQKHPLQITSGPGKRHYPTWEPRET